METYFLNKTVLSYIKVHHQTFPQLHANSTVRPTAVCTQSHALISSANMCHQVTYCEQEAAPMNPKSSAKHRDLLVPGRAAGKETKHKKTIKKKHKCTSFLSGPGWRKSRQKCLCFQLTSDWGPSAPDCSPICMTKTALFGSLGSFSGCDGVPQFPPPRWCKVALQTFQLQKWTFSDTIANNN